MATAYQSIKEQLDEKKAENETLKTQNGALTAKLKELPMFAAGPPKDIITRDAAKAGSTI